MKPDRLTVLILIFLAALLWGCETETPPPSTQAPIEMKTIEITGYSVVQLPANASNLQRHRARQKAQRLAAANLAAQTSGNPFVYKASQSPDARFSQLTISGQAVIKNSDITVIDIGRTKLMAKQTARVRLDAGMLQGAHETTVSREGQTVNGALLACYRTAVGNALAGEPYHSSTAVGRLYLKALSVNPVESTGKIRVTATLIVVPEVN